MSSLKFLVSSQNSLNGYLPDNLCRHLPRIQLIYLATNHFSGPIPSSLSECGELIELSLASNNFQGRIPTSIVNLTRATSINLFDNKLTGIIPEEIGKLHNLEKLDLTGNNITGTIPPSLFNITTINIIQLSDNQLSGGLPSNTGLWNPYLDTLYLGANQLSGPLPKSISNASQLTHVEMFDNHFSGYIPDISALKNLELLNLGLNNLTIGSDNIFSSISTLRNLRAFGLSNNPLNATLPASIGSNISNSLEQLYLSHCDLRGDIPSTLANLTSLILLTLVGNKLSGSIPTSFSKLEKIQTLSLMDNKLRGSIPLELCQLPRLYVLSLADNMLSGSIPSCLINTSASLKGLNLSSNILTSTIPPTIWGLEYILTIDISSNSLVGALSSAVGNLKVVTHFDVSNNQLSGNISTGIGELKNIAYLSVAHNKFAGSIPDSFGNLLSLEYLDLSNNNLTGEIPKSLEKLSQLKFINFSFNELYGVIPSGGCFPNFSSQSFMGNYALCGAPRLLVPPCKNTSKKANKAWLILRFIIPSIIVVVVIVVLLVIVFVRKGKINVDSEVTFLVAKKRVTRLELLTGTNGFNDENLLGTGSFGSVYKGMLSDGLVVAIKVFSLALEEAFASFDKECDLLCNIRHKNIVKVITCCSSPDFKALVLEYMPQGNLEKWLYSDVVFLSILQRLDIMADVASALEYLHHGYTTPIVHCDLKPGNVLLDEDMVAHVADFGIAKLLCGENSMTQTMSLATIGYMAPEYGAGGVVSKKGDVYSFGIMLMEIFTRKKPVDEMFSDEMSLRQWVEDALPHSISEVIDTDLLKPEDTQYSVKKDCILSLMELALACSTSSPQERLDMNMVTSTLRKIKMKFI